MKFAMCNEFCTDWPFDQACALAQSAGYDGIEVAPFTIAPSALDVPDSTLRAMRRTAQSHHLEIVGLHWLLAKTQGLHIHDPDPGVRRRTLDYYTALIRMCANLGGKRMIHGSPHQRNLAPNANVSEAWKHTVDFFQQAGAIAAQHDVVLCIEPLGPADTNFIRTKDEALQLIWDVRCPHVQLILDCKAMATESKSIPQLIHEAGPLTRHFHANDTNLSYPGSGSLDFLPILQALHDINYREYISIEVFDFTPSPEKTARAGLRHLKETHAQVTHTAAE